VMKSFIRLLMFLLAIIAVLELSLRYFYFGMTAFSLERMNSFTTMIDSDFVQAAEELEIYYELKPDLDVLFKGERLVTNSEGLADQEYSREKPAGVYRIAVVGSSWSMATGVTTEETYHAVLEERLQKQLSTNKVEVINFAVEYYGLGEIVGTVRHKVLPYNPDMILIALAPSTPAIKWQEHTEPFTKADTIAPFLQSYLISAMPGPLGRYLYGGTQRPAVVENGGGHMMQVIRAIQEISELTREESIDVAIVFFTYDKFNEQAISAVAKRSEKYDFRFVHANLKTEAREKNIKEDIIVSMDTHPNKIGHTLIAEKLNRELWPVKSINQPE
jgi:hypothetical protein